MERTLISINPLNIGTIIVMWAIGVLVFAVAWQLGLRVYQNINGQSGQTSGQGGY